MDKENVVKPREARDLHGPYVAQVMRSWFGVDRLSGKGHGREKKPIRVAEVGVFRGELSEYLLEQFPEIHLVMIDIWGGEPASPQYAASGDRCAKMSFGDMSQCKQQAIDRTAFAHKRRDVIHSRSVSQEVENYVALNGKFDMAFIDGDHTYQAVAADIRFYNSLLAPGGLMSGHDYRSPRDIRGQWGVEKAVHEFAGLNNLTVRSTKKCVWWYE